MLLRRRRGSKARRLVSRFGVVYFVHVWLLSLLRLKTVRKVDFWICYCGYCFCCCFLLSFILLEVKRGCEEEVCIPYIDVDIFVVVVVVDVVVVVLLLLSLLKRSSRGRARRSLGIICS